MHALILLSKLRFRGGWRKFRRTLFSVKGILPALFVVAFLGMAVIPNLFLPRQQIEGMPRQTWFVSPLALFGFWLMTSLAGRAKGPISFSLAEVEFLFPGPFTRRQLLTYKLLLSTLGALGFALMMPLFARLYLPGWWLSVLLGLWGTMTFMQFSTVLMALAVDRMGESAARWRNVAILVLALAIGSSLVQGGALAGDLTLTERLQTIEHGWAVKAVLAPFVVFNRFIVSDNAGDLLLWGAATLAINAITILAIVQLDANFLEASLLASQRRYQWIERAKRGGGVPAIGARSKPRFGLPMFPRIGGVGTIAWRQSLHLLRGSGRLLFVIPALMGPIAGFVTVGRGGHAPPSIAVVMFAMFFLGFLITTIMPLGMRSELQHADTIKTLPLGSTAIVWGSISAAIAYTTLVQALAAGTLLILLGGWSLGPLVGLAFAVPMNLLLVAVDTMLVILFPSTRQFTPGDPMVGVRMMMVYAAKMLVVALASLLAAFYVFVTYVMAGPSLVAMGLAGWLTLMIEGAVIVWLGGILFERYDPSTLIGEPE